MEQGGATSSYAVMLAIRRGSDPGNLLSPGSVLMTSTTAGGFVLLLHYLLVFREKVRLLCTVARIDGCLGN